MRQQIIKRLNEIAANSNTQDTWIIEYEGKRLTMANKKQSWSSIVAAKNALRNNMNMGSYRERLPTIKALEEEGIIKYIKL